MNCLPVAPTPGIFYALKNKLSFLFAISERLFIFVASFTKKAEVKWTK